MQTDFTPLYARIQRYIRDEIASRRLVEGDRIPSEPELAQRFDTTRATVSRALQQLVFEGEIVRRSGSGSFVAPRTLNAPIDLTHVRSFEDQMRARGATIGYEVVGFTSRRATTWETETLHLEQNAKVFALDRLRLVDERKIGLERRVIPEELGRKMTLDMLAQRSIHQMLDEEFGLGVHRVEGQIRAGAAPRTVAAHLGIKSGAPLLVRDYVLFSVDRRPLVCGESFYRDEFRIDYVVQHSGNG